MKDYRIPEAYWGHAKVITDTSPEQYCKAEQAEGWHVEFCANNSIKNGEFLKRYYILAQAIRHNAGGAIKRCIKHRISKLVPESELPQLLLELQALTEYDGLHHRAHLARQAKAEALEEAKRNLVRSNLAAIKAQAGTLNK